MSPINWNTRARQFLGAPQAPVANSLASTVQGLAQPPAVGAPVQGNPQMFNGQPAPVVQPVSRPVGSPVQAQPLAQPQQPTNQVPVNGQPPMNSMSHFLRQRFQGQPQMNNMQNYQ